MAHNCQKKKPRGKRKRLTAKGRTLRQKGKDSRQKLSACNHGLFIPTLINTLCSQSLFIEHLSHTRARAAVSVEQLVIITETVSSFTFIASFSETLSKRLCGVK